jgi:hypothetical protein
MVEHYENRFSQPIGFFSLSAEGLMVKIEKELAGWARDASI